MKKTLVAASLLLAFASPAFASDENAAKTFTRDGTTYVYTSAVKDGRLVLTGQTYPIGDAFKLVVSDNKVSGQFAGRPVSFKRDRTQFPFVASLAAR